MHWTPSCFPVENQPRCALPAALRLCSPRCLAGWTPTPNGLCSARAQVPSCLQHPVKAVRPTLPPVSPEMHGGGNGNRLRPWWRLNSTPPPRCSGRLRRSAGIVFLISPWKLLLRVPTPLKRGSRVSSSVHLGLNKGLWPARRSHAWATKLWVCLMGTNSASRFILN